jgi:ubiquinone/menaquinone biosynthesis C-methylase UbiE
MDQHTDPKHLTNAAYDEAGKLDARNEIQAAYGTHPVPWFQWVFAALDIRKNARVLELGCGSGMLWEENRSRILPGWNLILTDRSVGMLRASRQNLDAARLPARYLCTDSQHIPFPSKSFDIVVAIGLFDHIPNLNQALQEARRVLKPGGQLLASAGGQRHLAELRQLLKPYLPRERVDLLGGEEERFGAENGARRLAPFFEEVTQRDYPDRMVFTEIQPILDYVLSEESIVWDMPMTHLSRFVHSVKRQMTERGQVSVTIQKSLFLAKKLPPIIQ